MPQPYLFALASLQADWLSVRQATLAENIANANTPGFAARDVIPFAATLDTVRMEMVRTSAGHMDIPDARAASVQTVRRDGEALHSGNTVDLESEMIKLGSVGREYALNTGIVKKFHNLYLASLKG